MIRRDAERLRDILDRVGEIESNLKDMRDIARLMTGPEQPESAFTTMYMRDVQQWEPCRDYQRGDWVKHEGVVWECTRRTRDTDLAPDRLPQVWRVVPSAAAFRLVELEEENDNLRAAIAQIQELCGTYNPDEYDHTLRVDIPTVIQEALEYTMPKHEGKSPGWSGDYGGPGCDPVDMGP